MSLDIVDTASAINHDPLISQEKPSLTLTPTILAVPLVGQETKDSNPCGRTFVVDLTADNVSRVEHDKHTCPETPPSKLDIPHQECKEFVQSDAKFMHSPVNPPGLCKDEEVAPAGASSDEAPAAHAERTVDAVVQDLQSSPEDTLDVLDDIFHIDDSLFQTVSSRYCLQGVPKLDTFIADDLFPDDLFVHDWDNLTSLQPSKLDRDLPVRYVRVFPRPPPDAQADEGRPRRTAHLYLRASNRLGVGNHSSVYRTPFRLRLDPKSREWTTVSVVAKTSNSECGAHAMLDHEASVYNQFPRTLQEDVVPPPPQPPVPVPAPPSSDSHDANCLSPAPKLVDAEAKVPRIVEPAVVPKFYGYYTAVNADGRPHSERHVVSGCDDDSCCPVSWPTRLMLVEECGKPIQPYDMIRAHRNEVLELMRRLHSAGFTNGSTYTRNMLVQPGPLDVPPEERSMDSPSFRIIDFGRGTVRARVRRESTFSQAREDDLWRTRRELRL